MLMAGQSTDTDILCLKSIKNSLEDPNNYFQNWNFNNKTEVYLIDHPRAVDACEWYQHVLGAIVLSESFSTTGVPGNIAMIQHRYMRLGDGQRRTIIELQDSIRPRTEQSDRHGFTSLYSNGPNLLHDRFINGLGANQGTSLMINRHEQLFLSKIRDPFGFHWFVKTADPNLMLPPA
ncbi:unnamed protein product [Trifolium pratense]|uniref:Uncharacterized protein n=1 Tax=Trifolium pratense TaxID=57577 RepID=A0ACB0IYT6_TRIPR|nr:unnamed protein product [Trifolium pratense]